MSGKGSAGWCNKTKKCNLDHDKNMKDESVNGQLSLFGGEERRISVKKKDNKPVKAKDPAQSYDERMKRFWHYWNNKTAYENQIETCVGELKIIVDALADYCDYVSRKIDEMPQAYERAVWEIRRDKINAIQSKIEEKIGYNRDEQLIKCQKRRTAKEDDIGEDALIMALKKV